LRLIKLTGGKCVQCGSNKNPSIDHIIPVSKGGHDGLENLQVLCSKCNCKKGNRI
jgi:5-methylcytosine-specific restriction endonuclease McrA